MLFLNFLIDQDDGQYGERSFGFHRGESMRRTVSVILCVLVAVFCAGLNAQIPENAQFQPGSYAQPYRPAPIPTASMVVVPDDDSEITDESETEWERKFSPQTIVQAPPAPLLPYEVPHLTFVYNRWTGRFHIAPYEPGYAAKPSAFPVQTSPLHVWVSSRSAAAQPRSQVPYMSYYDPDPVILPAEIRMHGLNLAMAKTAPFTQMQPMPLPIPRPETAQPVSPPARTRLGERLRQNFGTFVVR